LFDCDKSITSTAIDLQALDYNGKRFARRKRPMIARKLSRRFVAMFALFSSAATCSFGAEPLQFNRDIRPILSDKCFACHGFDSTHREANLRLDVEEQAYKAGDSGETAIKPGDPAGSEVWKRITADDADLRMPPAKTHKTLSPAEKERLKRWIEGGAKYEKHWAFVPPVRPEVPAGELSPIDFFIRKKLTEIGLTPSPAATKESLLRRVTFELTGLPPTPEELAAFLADTSENAYEKQVDRLLASPRFGERMAVQWLDVARYGDTNGYLHDILRTGWPWRDWVIQAFNDDKPFDQFVIEQLAGDMLPGATEQQKLATAFSRNHLITAEGGTLAAEYLNEYSADRVQTTATAFLGLSFNCCRCHDHKFDPLTQEDFYGLQAYFNSTTERHHENDNAAAYPPLLEVASPLNPTGPKAKVMIMEEAAQPKPTFVLTRGQYDHPNKDRPATRRPPAVLGAALRDAPQNRLGLAQWIVSRENPLLARVTVNRLWQQLFGTGLVKTVDDFGVQGEYPSHPELLDFLAEEFREGKAGDSPKPWSVKNVVRLIVTSGTYRQASKVRDELTAKDPENRLLGRFPRQRLSAEEIRDQALFVSGLMSDEMGGPPVFPYQPAGLWEERSNEGSNTKVYKRSQGPALYRRSLYTFVKRTCPPPIMSLFDAPDRTSCSVRRITTNTPLQALATLNDEQQLECAKMLAVRTLGEQAATTKERLALLFRRVTSRTPEAAELETLEAALAGLLARYKAAPQDAAKLLTTGATPAPANLDKSEVAAWMLVASAILNLDETLVRH
jgi:hypothetical protein